MISTKALSVVNELGDPGPGALGTHSISVALLFRPAEVEPIGQPSADVRADQRAQSVQGQYSSGDDHRHATLLGQVQADEGQHHAAGPVDHLLHVDLSGTPTAHVEPDRRMFAVEQLIGVKADLEPAVGADEPAARIFTLVADSSPDWRNPRLRSLTPDLSSRLR